MAALSTIIGAVGLGLGAVGTVTQMIGSAQASEASKRAERIRERQMNLESSRQRRGIIRQALRARSMALTTGSDQGAMFGSGLAGGLGQIASSATGNIQGVNQSAELGTSMFRTNEQITSAQELASFGGGLSSLGSSLFSSSDTLGRIGNYFTQR